MTQNTKALEFNDPTDISIGLTHEQVARAPRNIPLHHATRIEMMIIVAKNQVLSFFFVLLVISGGLSLFLGETIDSI